MQICVSYSSRRTVFMLSIPTRQKKQKFACWFVLRRLIRALTLPILKPNFSFHIPHTFKELVRMYLFWKYREVWIVEYFHKPLFMKCMVNWATPYVWNNIIAVLYMISIIGSLKRCFFVGGRGNRFLLYNNSSDKNGDETYIAQSSQHCSWQYILLF